MHAPAKYTIMAHLVKVCVNLRRTFFVYFYILSCSIYWTNICPQHKMFYISKMNDLLSFELDAKLHVWLSHHRASRIFLIWQKQWNIFPNRTTRLCMHLFEWNLVNVCTMALSRIRNYRFVISALVYEIYYEEDFTTMNYSD